MRDLLCLTSFLQASSILAHSHSTGASGPLRKRRASSASLIFPWESRNRGVSGMKHMNTSISVGGIEDVIANHRQSKNKPDKINFALLKEYFTQKLQFIIYSTTTDHTVWVKFSYYSCKHSSDRAMYNAGSVHFEEAHSCANS